MRQPRKLLLLVIAIPVILFEVWTIWRAISTDYEGWLYIAFVYYIFPLFILPLVIFITLTTLLVTVVQPGMARRVLTVVFIALIGLQAGIWVFFPHDNNNSPYQVFNTKRDFAKKFQTLDYKIFLPPAVAAAHSDEDFVRLGDTLGQGNSFRYISYMNGKDNEQYFDEWKVPTDPAAPDGTCENPYSSAQSKFETTSNGGLRIYTMASPGMMCFEKEGTAILAWPLEAIGIDSKTKSMADYHQALSVYADSFAEQEPGKFNYWVVAPGGGSVQVTPDK